MDVSLRPRIGQEVTWAQWEAMGLTDERYEVVDGRLVVSPGASRRHQYAVSVLVRILSLAAETVGLVAIPDVDWRLWEAPRLQVRRPDLIVVPAADLDAEPVLAIEVLSPGNRGTDLVDKPHEYARAGLSHYWVVSLDEPEVIVFSREVDRLVETARFNDALTVPEPFPVEFRVADLVPKTRGE